MQEAAPDFVVRVGVGLEQVVHHGQEVSVNRQDVFNVGEQNLREDRTQIGDRLYWDVIFLFIQHYTCTQSFQLKPPLKPLN